MLFKALALVPSFIFFSLQENVKQQVLKGNAIENFFSLGTYSRTGLSFFTSGTFAAGGTLKEKDFLVNTTRIRRTQEMHKGEISLNMPQGSLSGRKP